MSPQHACAVFADEAIALLREHQTEPFFCYVPFDGSARSAHRAGQIFRSATIQPRFRCRQISCRSIRGTTAEMHESRRDTAAVAAQARAVRAMIAEYYRYISYLDAQIGRVLDALDASPHAKNTIVVFAADSRRGARQSRADRQTERLRAFDARAARSSRARHSGERTTDAMCYLFDVLPTLGELCGVAGAERPAKGSTSAPTLRRSRKTRATAMMFAYRDVQRGCAMSGGS